MTIKEIIGYQNSEELAARLKPIMMVRQRNIPVKFTWEEVTISPEMEAVYLKAAQGILGGTPREFVGRLPQLQLAANNSILEGGEPNTSVSLCGKELAFVALLDKMLRAEKCVIIYSSFLESIARIEFVLGVVKTALTYQNIYRITGSQSSKERERVSKGFGPGDIILMTRAGGVSLNLQQSNQVIFYDIPFSVADFVQVVGRVARMDSTHSEMMITSIIAKGTIDEYKMRYLQMNSLFVSNLIGSNVNLPQVKKTISKEMVKELRKELLWRTRKGSKRKTSSPPVPGLTVS